MRIMYWIELKTHIIYIFRNVSGEIDVQHHAHCRRSFLRRGSVRVYGTFFEVRFQTIKIFVNSNTHEFNLTFPY